MTVSREEAATTIQRFYKAYQDTKYIMDREREMDAYYEEMDRIAEMDAYYDDYEEKCTSFRDDQRGYTKSDALFHRLSREREAPLIKAARD
jgi:hypothetical protein